MQRVLESRAFIAAILAMATGAFLFYTQPFPEQQIFLRVIAVRAPQVFLSFKYLYYALLFTTPYLVCSTALSGLYIFTLKPRRTVSPGRLPQYPDPGTRSDLFLVVGEVHNPRKPVPAKAPSWLTIPERGLFTGIAILGAIGSGKTSCCMLPFAEQILAYKAADKEKRIGGIVLEVKGDFCRKVKDILARHQRAEDYIEISLDSEYCYNPLHNDLDAYALAYNIASLLNNLFGRGKEPFWQQAYTNLVKFIILLHKVAYDYVTLFDVYQCAISPPLLEERIAEAEEIILGHHYVAVTPKTLWRAYRRPRGSRLCARREGRPFSCTGYSRASRHIKDTRDSVRGSHGSRPRSGQPRKACATRGREEMVPGRLEEDRAEITDFHRRGCFRLPLALR